MDCRTARLLLPYASSPTELAEEDAAEFAAHVGACQDCGAIASREQSFDRAVGNAMNAIEVPAGLREAIHTRMAQEHARVWRRGLLPAAAVAALLFLTAFIGYQWWNAPIEVSPDQLVAEQGPWNVGAFNDNFQTATEFFQARRLRTALPDDLDYKLLLNLDVVEFKGKPVATLDFQKGQARAKVYILPKQKFRFPKNSPREISGSGWTIEVTDGPGEFLTVIVYFGGGTRQMFQIQGGVT